MRVDLLGAIITIAGIIFFLFSLALIFLGKKIGGDDKTPQKVKVGKYVEISTNAVLMLVLITACFAMAPLALTFWKPDLSNYVHKSDLAKNYLAIDDLSMIVHGVVLDQEKRFADSVDIVVIRGEAQQSDTLHDMTDEQGMFYIELHEARPMEKYSIIWQKPGYSERRVSFRFNEIAYPLVLEKEGGP